MQIVNIKRDELLAKVKANREVHEKDYNEALEVYRKAAIEKFRAMLNDALDGKAIQTKTDLVEPVTKLSEYDRTIAMLEMSIDENIELSSNEFDCYVLDNWSWKAHAMFANSTYK